MPPTPRRGSANLAIARTIPPRDLAAIIDLTRRRGVRLVDWNIVGQPSPEAIDARIEVSPAGAPKLIQELLRYKHLRPHIEIFPVGIPNPANLSIRFRI